MVYRFINRVYWIGCDTEDSSVLPQSILLTDCIKGIILQKPASLFLQIGQRQYFYNLKLSLSRNIL